MTIAVRCRCGQRFAAQPHLAGKVVPCPSCQSPIVIPTASAPVAAVPVRPQTTAQDVFVSCKCGQQFKAIPSLIGKTVACPSCRQPLHVKASPPAPAASDFGNFADLGNFAMPAQQPRMPTASMYGSPYAQPKPAASRRSSADQKTFDVRMSNALMVVGILGKIGSRALASMENDGAFAISLIVGVIGLGFWTGGTCFYARSKGLHWAWGFLGIISIVGLVILVSMSGQTTQKTTSHTGRSKYGDADEKKSGLHPAMIAVIALFGVMMAIVVVMLLIPAFSAAAAAAARMREKNAASAAGNEALDAPINSASASMGADEGTWVEFKGTGYSVSMPVPPRESSQDFGLTSARGAIAKLPDHQQYEVFRISPDRSNFS